MKAGCTGRGRGVAAGIVVAVGAAVAIVSAVFVSACKSPVSPDLKGGVLATFGVQGETFKILVKNEATIRDLYDMQAGTISPRHPNGKLLAGAVSYNSPWTWHVDSQDVQMVEVSMELCDGLPSHVQENLDYWVDTVGRFCPWTATLLELKDYR